jgi:cytochrome c-type biogenesis protein CcmF
MNQFGNFALFLAWALALFGMCAGVVAGRTRSEPWFHTTRNATILSTLCGLLSLGILGALFAASDFSNNYVWGHSDRGMPWYYKVSAIWGGMDGSMLLWAAFLSISTGIVAYFSINSSRQLMPYVLSVANSSALFFYSVTFFLTNPFKFIQAPFIPPDGNGLNPLLQNPFMAIHPPMLYAGFTTFSVPFAFCLGALLAGSVTNEWIRLARRWTLLAWAFLTAGIVLGGYWAYIELGWGGFWAWDPVENASFLPWLTGTAFLHSVLVQERKNMLKFWNVWLIVLTYGLTVLGTFLTRSGIVQSVHAFASTDMPEVFLIYLGGLVLFAGWLSWVNRHTLRSERRIESYLSREAAFLFQNMIFLSICFATLWGVLFPTFSEVLTGERQTVGVPFFNQVNRPLFFALIFFMGVGPLIAWRKASWSSLWRTFSVPFLGGCALSLFVFWGGITEYVAVVSYGLCFFVLLTIFGELHRGIRAQRTPVGDHTPGVGESFLSLMRRHGGRFAGYLVHFGVLVMAVAITASMVHKQEQEFALRNGETFSIGRFNLTLEGVSEGQTNNFQFAEAQVHVRDAGSGKDLGVVKPQIRVYTRNRETTTEVSILKSWRDDLYLVLAGLDDNGARASMKVFVNPLQSWLWVGTFITLFGTLLVMIPGGVRARAADRVVGGVAVSQA